MPKEFIVVGTYDTALQANAFRASLEGHGIPAFLENERAVETQWLWSNAVGGVRLLVPAADCERALAILAAARDDLQKSPIDEDEDDDLNDDYTDEGDEDAIEGEEYAAQPHDETYAELSQRERDAFQALKLAVIGLMLCPLQLFVPYYVVRALAGSTPMRGRYYFCLAGAVLIQLPFLVGVMVFTYHLLTEP
jgi:hypothetical protein